MYSSRFPDADLEELIQTVMHVNGHGIAATQNATSELNWNFVQSVFFASTVITTIGI